MNTQEASSELDRLLVASGEVDPVPRDVLLAAGSAVLAEAHTATARAARSVRLRRRYRRLATGIAATAAVGAVAVTLTFTGNNTKPGTPIADPGRHPQAPVEAHFTTVAQVVDAAAIATAPVDPTASPYWKVVTSWDCGGVPAANGASRPSGSTCQNTMWTGNGRPGVLQDINGDTMQVPQGTINIDGQTLTWAQANSQTWTAPQIASMVADNAGTGKTDRAPSDYYVFKNALGLLTYTPASPEIRKQLWHQLAEVPGVELDGRATDALGRTGWRLTWTSRIWGSESMIIDTTTGMPLEQSDKAPGARTANVTTIVSAGPSEAAPAAPSSEQLRQQKLARARACGVIPRSEAHVPFQIQTGRVPVLTKKQQSCLDADSNTPVPMN